MRFVVVLLFGGVLAMGPPATAQSPKRLSALTFRRRCWVCSRFRRRQDPTRGSSSFPVPPAGDRCTPRLPKPLPTPASWRWPSTTMRRPVALLSARMRSSESGRRGGHGPERSRVLQGPADGRQSARGIGRIFLRCVPRGLDGFLGLPCPGGSGLLRWWRRGHGFPGTGGAGVPSAPNPPR